MKEAENLKEKNIEFINFSIKYSQRWGKIEDSKKVLFYELYERDKKEFKLSNLFFSIYSKTSKN